MRAAVPAWSAARRGGTVVVVGAGRTDQQVAFSPFELFFDEKALLGSVYGSADVRRDFPRLIALWRAGRLDLAGMITQRRVPLICPEQNRYVPPRLSCYS